jgi:hypothetical protein
VVIGGRKTCKEIVENAADFFAKSFLAKTFRHQLLFLIALRKQRKKNQHENISQKKIMQQKKFHAKLSQKKIHATKKISTKEFMQQKKIRAKKNQTSFEKKIRFERKKIVAFAKGRKFP